MTAREDASAPVDARVAETLAAIDRSVATQSPAAAALAETRAGMHRLRNALSPVSDALQLLAEREPLTPEARKINAGGQAALAAALQGLDDVVAAVRSVLPPYRLADALAGAKVVGEVPEISLPGSPDFLRLALEHLAAEAGGALEVRVRLEPGSVVVEASTPSVLDPRGFALRLGHRLASRAGGRLALEPGRVLFRIAAPALAAPKAASTLLIVDDEPDLAPLFRRFLRRHFQEILEAGDARKAEAQLGSHPVTHLVVDATLPGAEPGQALVQKWRAAVPSVRFAAVFSGSTALRGARFAGVDGVYIKPEGFDELIEVLRRSAAAR